MRHQKKRNQLGRTASHRKATLAAMASALIEHKRIETTLPKAKALRTFIEPLITRAKEDNTHNRREAFRHLRDKRAVTELFGEVATHVGDRPGGLDQGVRAAEGGEMARVLDECDEWLRPLRSVLFKAMHQDLLRTEQWQSLKALEQDIAYASRDLEDGLRRASQSRWEIARTVGAEVEDLLVVAARDLERERP
jgi:large subunit ribosomal protein L17